MSGVQKLLQQGLQGLALATASLLLAGCEREAGDIYSAQDITEMRSDIREAMTLAQSTRGDGHPAMWTLADDDTTIHIFGTVHILPPGLDWRSDAFNAAFSAADTFVMETVDADEETEAALMMQMMKSAMYPDGETLESKLTPRDYAAVEAAAENIGLPAGSMNQMKPWFAAVSLELMLAYEQGYEEEEGVEFVLEAEALATGKKLGALETSEFQMTLFDRMSERAQLEYLVSSAVTIDMAREVYQVDLAEWLDGDVAGQSALMEFDEATESEGAIEFYDMLLKDRNAAWIPQIEAMLDQPGTTMIAVGAAHLAGDYSVITMLRDNGHVVEGP